MQKNITKSIYETLNFFNNRVLQHNKDGLFLTVYSNIISEGLEKYTEYNMLNWKILNGV